MIGKNVSLVPGTNAMWHEFFSRYAADPMMDAMPFVYQQDICEMAYEKRKNDATREYFSIMAGGELVGQIYLKHIDWNEKSAEFGIALINDSVKGKGYGAEAIELLTEYAFDVLGLEVMTANSVLRNVRSQHVLEKVGFVYTHSDEKFRYYRLEKR